MPYFVIIESTENKNYGLRTALEFSSKIARLNSYSPDSNTIIVEEGVSIDRAQELVSLTPEISYLVSAAFDSTDENGLFSHLQHARQLAYAREHIKANREISRQHHLTPPEASKAVLTFLGYAHDHSKSVLGMIVMEQLRRLSNIQTGEVYL